MRGSPWQRISRGSTLARDKALMITQGREEPNSQFSATIGVVYSSLLVKNMQVKELTVEELKLLIRPLAKIFYGIMEGLSISYLNF